MKHNKSAKSHATNIRITSTTRHKKHFSTSNTKVNQVQRCPDRKKRSGHHCAYLDETLELGVAVRRELLLRNVMTFSLYKCHRVHIYSPEIWRLS